MSRERNLISSATFNCRWTGGGIYHSPHGIMPPKAKSKPPKAKPLDKRRGKVVAAAARPPIPPWGSGPPLELPDDCWFLIMSFLNPRDVAVLSSVSAQLHELVPTEKWAAALAQQYPRGINLLEFPAVEAPSAAFCALHCDTEPLCRLCYSPLGAAAEGALLFFSPPSFAARTALINKMRPYVPLTPKQLAVREEDAKKRAVVAEEQREAAALAEKARKEAAAVVEANRKANSFAILFTPKSAKVAAANAAAAAAAVEAAAAAATAAAAEAAAAAAAASADCSSRADAAAAAAACTSAPTLGQIASLLAPAAKPATERASHKRQRAMYDTANAALINARAAGLGYVASQKAYDAVISAWRERMRAGSSALYPVAPATLLPPPRKRDAWFFNRKEAGTSLSAAIYAAYIKGGHLCMAGKHRESAAGANVNLNTDPLFAARGHPFAGAAPSPSPPAAVCHACSKDKTKVVSAAEAARTVGITVAVLCDQACVPIAERNTLGSSKVVVKVRGWNLRL